MLITGTRTRENPEFLRTYRTWHSMMSRCYNRKTPVYINYGGKGCFVNERWHSYNNFLEDIDKIIGFDYKLFISGNLALDKDKNIKGNKEYSKNKCCFITLEENNKYKPNQQREVEGLDPEGNFHYFFNQSEFARSNNLRQSSIGDCLSGKCKTHRKWKFKYRK